MIDQRFVLLGAALGLLGSSRYAWQTVHGRTQPNRVTWFLWALAPIIGFVAQLADGVRWPAVMTLSVGLGPAVVLASSFANRAGYWRITRFDLLCGAMSVVALVVWLTLDRPVLAIVFAVLADLMAGVPTVRKAWTAPETEHPSVFVMSGINAIITLLTIREWSLSTWLFPVYIVSLCVLLTSLVTRRPPSHRTGRAVTPAH